ncbi:hypothetical protein [Streptomyces sp. NPDC001450]
MRYEVGDGSELRPTGGRFDVATAVRLLNYAQDVAAMEGMRGNVHQSLAPGVEFFVLARASDRRSDGPSPRKYGFLGELTDEEAETGPRVGITASGLWSRQSPTRLRPTGPRPPTAGSMAEPANRARTRAS